MLGEFVRIAGLQIRFPARHESTVDECCKPIDLVDDHTRVLGQWTVVELPLQQLRGTAHAAERVLHLVRELAHDLARNLPLGDQFRLLPQALIERRIGHFEQQTAALDIGVQPAIEHQWLRQRAAGEITQAEAEIRLQRALTQVDQLICGHDDVADLLSEQMPLTRTEQVFR